MHSEGPDTGREAFERGNGMFDLSKNWAELPSLSAARAARVSTDMADLPPLDLQPPWDIPDKVVITAAASGRIARSIDAEQTSGFGLDLERFITASADCIEAGAAGVHFDILGIPKILESNPTLQEAYTKIYAGINERTSRDWICDANILYGNSFEENTFPIVSGIAETIPMAPNFPVDWMESVAYVASKQGVPLTMSIHSTAEVDLAQRLVLSKGIHKLKPMWAILIGYPYDDSSRRLATFLPHPKAMMQELIQIVDRIREIDPDAFIYTAAAGRSAHYMTTASMLLGLHVRVGTEDTAFIWPHSDEFLPDSADSVRRAVATAEVLGRKVATPDEARQLYGLPARTRSGA